jgi:hypothetical protein
MTSENGKGKEKHKSKENDTEPVIRKEVVAYKYSQKGRSSLNEAIILCGEPCFVTWYPNYGTNNENLKIIPVIEESTRIIRPPSSEEYPYTPYDFADVQELNEYFRRGNTTSLNDLYKMAKGFFQQYVDQNKNTIVILSADSILTYFQDLFPIIHYSEGIGGNDAGKSSIGYTFEYAGYRVVRGTSISGANYYRILGNIEPGQCTIIEDEADSISDDPDKVRILKSGYEYNAKIPKTNMNTRNQEQNWYYPYCYKILLAEKSLSEWKAKGLVDRTFSHKCRPGKVRYSIKKVVSQTINKSPELQRLYDELLDFRKLMLCYRLIHYADDLPEIKISVINRDEELSYPLLQLFYGTEAFEEIKTAVEYFLHQRKRRRSRSLEAALYPVLKDLINARTESNIVDIFYSDIWKKITEENSIKGNLYSDTQYETLEYGPIYQNTFSRFIADKFSAELDRKNTGSILTFDKAQFIDSFDELYNHRAQDSESEVKIDVQLVNSEGSDDSDGSSDASTIDYATFDERNKAEKKANPCPEPSQPSQPSPTIFIKCPLCKFENIYQKVIDHHVRLSHNENSL